MGLPWALVSPDSLVPHQLARLQQQHVDFRAMGGHIQLDQRFRVQRRHPLRLFQSGRELSVNGLRRLPFQRFRQIPQQLVQLTHHRKHFVHTPGRFRSLPPVTPGVGHLRDLLTGPKAVVHGAAAEAPLAERAVNAAAKILLQVGAGPACRLVNGKIDGSRKRQRHAAQPKAVLAIRL
ncbi:hypothetical protein D1872_243750 [compost metagenome]